MKVAVIDFVTPQGAGCTLSAPLAEELTLMLFDHRRFSIIERRMLSKVLTESSTSQTDLFDPAAVSRFGRLLGVDGVVTGTIAAEEREYSVNARIIAVETAEVASVALVRIPRSVAEQRGSCLGDAGIGGPRVVPAKQKAESIQAISATSASAAQTLAPRDRRPRTYVAKTLAAMEQDLANTKRTIAATPSEDPSRAALLFRLGEILWQMHEQVGPQETTYREECIMTSALIIKQYPSFAKLDAVLFSLGYALAEMKRFEESSKLLRVLVKQYPMSDYVANAYLEFAERYVQTGDLGTAKQFYRKVTEIPPERNRVLSYARERLKSL